MRFAEIRVMERIERADSLIQEHWQELATSKAVMTLKPNLAHYAALEEAGVLVSVGAFDGTNMVGYSVNTIGPHPHYSDLIVIQNDVIFLTEEVRKRGDGALLMDETERMGKERAEAKWPGHPCMMLWHAKPGTALEAILLERGFMVQDILLSKVL